jgi:hypothetical protein
VQRSGLEPASYGQFIDLPLTETSKQSLSGVVDAVAARSAKLFLTVEPMAGLDAVTPAVAQDLATTVAGYNARGVDVFVRFAHEMNGSWYPWGQQPAAYVAAFRRVADAVHATAPRTAMVWAPNYGGGYPFSGGTYSARAGSADFNAMDTDGTGALSMSDDPCQPYYPGDASVDWVGLTLYHFGNAWPYGENETPEAGKLAQQLRGTYNGNGRYEDQSALPDFYADLPVGHGKPMVLAETGALYNETPPQPGSSEYDVKAAWVNQVYGEGARAAFPQLKMVNWFEVRKYEAKGTVDWRATANASVRDLLRSAVGGGSYPFASSAARSPAPTSTPAPPATATTPGAPTSLRASALGAPSRVVPTWKPPTSTGGAPLTGYAACGVTGGGCVTVSPTTTTVTFSSVRSKTSYSFTVAATNSAGTGAAASVTVRTK